MIRRVSAVFRIESTFLRRKVCRIHLQRSRDQIVCDDVPSDEAEGERHDGADANFLESNLPIFDASVLENGDADE